MTTMRVLLSLGLLLTLSECKEKTYPVVVLIDFLPAVTIRPTARTMHRGDTLWLEANFSDSLLDFASGHRYRVRPQDLQLNSFIVYKELLGVGKDPAGIAPTFQIVNKVGRAWINGSFTGGFEPLYDGHYYRAKIGLIPTKACIASLTMSLNPSIGGTKAIGKFLPFIQLPPDAQGREQKAGLDESFYAINDGKANNFDLFQQYYRTYSQDPGVPLKTTIYEQKSTFTIEVK